MENSSKIFKEVFLIVKMWLKFTGRNLSEKIYSVKKKNSDCHESRKLFLERSINFENYYEKRRIFMKVLQQSNFNRKKFLRQGAKS